MPIRWVINPVIETVDGDTTTRLPKVFTLSDPGRPGKTYQHSSIILDSANWCLSFVRAADMSTLDADAQCINLLETDYEDVDDTLAKTVRDLGWSAAKRNRVLQRLTDKGVDTTGITLDTALWQILVRIAQAFYPQFTRAHLNLTRVG